MYTFRYRLFTRKLLLVILVLSFFLPGCSQTKTNELWIAVAGPMTGENAQYGDVVRKAAQLAIDEINSSGGINGKILKLQIEDDKMDPKDAAVVAEKLGSDKKVLAVVGHVSSSASLAAIPIYDRYHLVMITPSSTNPSLSGISPYFFRACVTDKIVADSIGNYVAGVLKPNKVAVMYAITDGAITNKDRFIEYAKEKGIDVVSDDGHNLEDKDFTAVLTRIASLKPDVIYLATSYTAAALISKQADEVGLTNVSFIGIDAVYAPDLIKIGGKSVEGLMAAGFFHPDNPAASAVAFIKAYRDKWGEDPEGFGANAYDSVYIIAEAIKNGAVTREDIQVYLNGIGSLHPAYSGVTGSTSFDKNHDSVKPVVITRVENGKWVFVTMQMP